MIFFFFQHSIWRSEFPNSILIFFWRFWILVSLINLDQNFWFVFLEFLIGIRISKKSLFFRSSSWESEILCWASYGDQNFWKFLGLLYGHQNFGRFFGLLYGNENFWTFFGLLLWGSEFLKVFWTSLWGSEFLNVFWTSLWGSEFLNVFWASLWGSEILNVFFDFFIEIRIPECFLDFFYGDRNFWTFSFQIFMEIWSEIQSFLWSPLAW